MVCFIAQSESKIISSRKRLATILDTADDGIITINQLGLVQNLIVPPSVCLAIRPAK